MTGLDYAVSDALRYLQTMTLDENRRYWALICCDEIDNKHGLPDSYRRLLMATGGE